jgi:rfaE bifunctional protein nucleotidyltransferase chain/domain
MYQQQRIFSLKEVRTLVEKLRQQRKRIATTNGCFDLLHQGHIAILKETWSHGDVTIVGLNSDRSVRLSKGDTRPIRSQKERAELLLSLPWVNYVVIFHDKDCIPFVATVKPDFHINDSGYGYDCIERETVEKNGGKLVIVKKVKCKSTTEIIKSILKKHKKCS